MINPTKRNRNETRAEIVRRQFREHALRLAPNPAVVVYDSFGRPRPDPSYWSVLALNQKAKA